MQTHDDDVLRAPTAKAREATSDQVASPAHSLQQSAGNRAVAQLLQGGVPDDDPGAALDRGLSSPGSALPADVQREMEGTLGTDLSSVRIHTGDAAESSAAGLGARAYTVGEDVVMGAGAYSPSSDEGRRTLAHELTHVVQQRSGPVDGTDVGGGVSVSDPSDRFEREAEANARNLPGTSSQQGIRSGEPTLPSTGLLAGAVQREELSEDEPPQVAAPVPEAAEEESDEHHA